MSSTSTDHAPVVSIVMPAYNAERFISETLRSILAQTFTDWELIVVDDGSTDGTSSAVAAFGDSRTIVIRHAGNLGLPRSYNDGIRAARGTFIARMDADDVMAPDRLHLQAMFLRQHPDIGIVGTAISMMDERGRYLGSAARPSAHVRIKWTALFSTPLYHPTVMARAAVLKEHPYDETIPRSEDYELWSRLLFTTDIRFSNLPEKLVRHRIHTASATRANAERGRHSAGNSIANIERYMPLSAAQRDAVLAGKHAGPFGWRHVRTLWKLGGAAADAFIAQERPTPEDARWIRQRVRSMRGDLLRTYVKSTLGTWRR